MHSVKLDGRDVAVGKIVCIGRNYAEHIRELGNRTPDTPVIFMKPVSSLLADGGSIVIPPYSTDCHYETELAVLIGRSGKEIAEADAIGYVAGYGVALDLTLRDVQGRQKEKGLPWEIAKGFDSACPISAFVPADQVGDPQQLQIRLTINDEIRQDGNSRNMMRPISNLIAEISRCFTLEEGDIVLTGTPAGVGPIRSGDRLVATIERVGTLSVSVA
jgi:5-carboxymethyl-2-hydroxymuconate isomerase